MSNPVNDNRASDNRRCCASCWSWRCSCSASAARWCRCTGRSARSPGINLVTREDPRVAQRAKNTQVDTTRIDRRRVRRQPPGTVELPAQGQPHDRSTRASWCRSSTSWSTSTAAGWPGRRSRATRRSQSAQYFKKLECFCFQQQTLEAGESRKFPVVFFIARPAARREADHAVVHVLRGGGRHGEAAGRRAHAAKLSMQADAADPTMSQQPDKNDPLRRKASLGQTARAVFWSFFGIRKRAHYESDAARLNPVHVIVIGILGAALFIGVLLVIIKWVVTGIGERTRTTRRESQDRRRLRWPTATQPPPRPTISSRRPRTGRWSA